MIRVTKISGLSNHLITPSVRTFPDLRRHEGINLRKKNWIRMIELDEAVTSTLITQGYNQCPTRYIPKYETFDFRHFLPHLKRFVWINHDPQTNADSQLLTGDSTHECPFKDRSLYVLEAWATRVLKLTSSGVIAFQKNNRRPSRVIGIHWDGKNFEEDELLMLLFK